MNCSTEMLCNYCFINCNLYIFIKSFENLFQNDNYYIFLLVKLYAQKNFIDESMVSVRLHFCKLLNSNNNINIDKIYYLLKNQRY